MSAHRRPADDEGSLAVMVAIMGVSFFALAGLVIDGARDLRARSHVLAYAQEAARAGADAGIQRTSAELALDPAAVEAAAERYCRAANVSLASDGTAPLAGCGSPGSPISSVNGDCVSVTLSMNMTTGLLDIVGIDTLSVTESGRAEAVQGLTARDAVAPAGGCP